MRNSIFGALFAIALVSTGAGAQHPGSGVGVFFSYVFSDPIYEGTAPGPAGTLEFDQVTLRATRVIGLRLASVRNERWAVTAEAAYASTNYDYLTFTSFDQSVRTGDGSVVTMLLSIDRTLARTDGLRLGALLQGGMYRLALNRNPAFCVHPAPGVPTCTGEATPWQRTHDVPSVGGGLTLATRLRDRMTLDFRGTSSVGRIDTRSFQTDLPPTLAQDAGRSHWLRVTQLSVGLEIGL